MSLSEICQLDGHEDRVWHVSWSNDGKALASCGGDKTIRIYTEKDSNCWECVAVLEEAQGRTIRACEWSPCRRYIASVSFDATTVIWEKQGESYEVIATLEGHESEVKSVSWNRDGSLLATCSRDKSVWLWEGDASTDFECVSVLHGHEQDVKFVKWHPTKPMLFSASYDDTIRVWEENIEDWYCSEVLKGHQSTIWGIASNQKGDRIASCSADNSVIVWKFHPDSQDKSSDGNIMRWKQQCHLNGFHSRPIYSIDWSTSTNLLVTGSADDSLRVFREVTEDTFELLVNHPAAHAGDINCVRWNPIQSQILASAGDDGIVRLWKFQ